MSDNDYKLLAEDAGQFSSMDTDMYKNGGYEGGRTPPPPYGMDITPQPYGMVSSPVNPMMMMHQQGFGGAPQQGFGGGAPQQAQPPPQPQFISVLAQPHIAAPTSVGQDPIRLQCPSCRQFIKSSVDRKSICKTHMCACLLFVCFCWPCVCIPYCSSSCRDANHTCPNCKAFLGTYKA